MATAAYSERRLPKKRRPPFDWALSTETCAIGLAHNLNVNTELVPIMSTHPAGAPSGQLSDWVITRVAFNGFAGLPTEEGEIFQSEFSCFGHEWTVDLYPGGNSQSNDGYVGLFLSNSSAEAIEVELKFIIKHPKPWYTSILRTDRKLNKFSPPTGSPFVRARGYENFARWSTLLHYLDYGTLIVEVHIRTNKPGCQPAPFVPENPASQNMLKSFGNEETVDVKFEVGGVVESAMDGRDPTKTPTTTFHGHHYPLQLNAPALADMCSPGDDSAPTTINNVEPAIFKHLLYYCYGGKISKEDLQSSAKAIIEAADRFGIVNLKLEAEACYVDTVEMTLDNIIEVVTYADSKNLALLKEHCMDFLSCADKVEVAEKVSFDDMPSRLMKDLMVAMARSESKSSKGDELSTMRVSELRRLAHEKGLNVDGSREMLIASLKAMKM